MRLNTTVGPAGQRRIPHDTLVAVCDGEHALLLRNVGSALHPELQQMRSLKHDNPKASTQGTDRPGRFNDGPNVHRSAMDETDRHELEKKRFAQTVADAMHDVVVQDEVASVVLVAPPSMLGELRARLHPDVQRCVIAEIDKLLTHHSLSSIQRIVLDA